MHTVVVRTFVMGFFGVAVSMTARAQSHEEASAGGLHLSPSFQTDFIYDENLFFSRGTEGIPASYLTFSPALQATHRTRRSSFEGGVSMTSERYFDELEPLSEALARATVSAGIQHALNERTSLSAAAVYVSTLRPGELIPDTGLDVGRRRGSGLSGFFNLNRATSRRSSINVQYGLSRTALDSAVDSSSGNLAHTLTAGWSLRTSSRNALNISYVGRLFQYIDDTPTVGRLNAGNSHALSFGVVRQMGRRVFIQLGGGPRLTEELDLINAGQGLERTGQTRIVPEIVAAANYQARRSDFTLSYSRSQSQTFGLSGFVNTESLSFTASFAPNRALSFSVTPSVFRNTRAELEVRSYTVLVTGGVQPATWFGMNVTYSFRQQSGELVFGTDTQGFRARNAVTLSLLFGGGV